MEAKVEQTPATDPNPVLSAGKDGIVLYSNEAGNTLLNGWGVKIGEKLPSSIGDLVQKVISWNSPEKTEIKVENRIYLVVFSPIPEQECVNISGFDISYRKELEGKLQESENKYRNIVETSVEGIWIFNAVSETTYVNEKMAEMLGYNREEMIGRFIWDFAYEGDKDIFQIKLANRKQGIDEVYELKLLRKDGSPLWVSVSAKGFFDDAGKFEGSVGMFTDITERKEVEKALKKAHNTLEEKVKERTAELEHAYNSLKESEKGLAEAQQMAHIGNWVWDIKTDSAYWSDEMYRIFGRDPQKLAPPYIEYLSYMHPDDRDHAEIIHKEAINGKHFSMDRRIVSANGEVCLIHMQTQVIFDDNDIPIKLKGTIQDITERKKAEEKIQYLANIVESSKDAIGTISLDGIITSWNKGAEQVYGYSSKEILGKHVSILAPSHLNKETMELIELIKQGKNAHHYETPRLVKDGKEIYVAITYSPVFDTNGNLTAISIIGRDITERKRAGEALRDFEIARKKEIHHRIKNNLQIISSLLDLQAEKFRNRRNIKDSEVLEAFKESQDRVTSMALIHEELHKGGEINTLNFSHYIEELADNLFLSYRLGNEGISLDTDIEEDIFFDIDMAVPLGIIINELISNSLKHAFSGRDKGEIRIKLHREKGCNTTYILSVSDNGIGIPEDLNIEDLDSLGLQLVSTLVEQLDGELELKRDNGTEFIIRFAITGNYDLELM